MLPWETELVPRSQHKEFLDIIFRFPPEFSSEGIKIVVDFVGNAKCGHGVVGYGLSNRVYENPPSSLGQALTSPTYEFGF